MDVALLLLFLLLLLLLLLLPFIVVMCFAPLDTSCDAVKCDEEAHPDFNRDRRCHSIAIIVRHCWDQVAPGVSFGMSCSVTAWEQLSNLASP